MPSNGVGTGFDRSALESLRGQRHGLIFDPDCLTEDYENGFIMHAAGFRQIFVPMHWRGGVPVATREYFPRNRRAAIRQRSRWVAGIGLQGWERHGWRVPVKQIYWFWRDRKGLAGNLVSPLANLLFLVWVELCAAGHRWQLSCEYPAWLTGVCSVSLGISFVQTALRTHLSARIYGLRFACAAPLRVFWGNLINCAATLQAFHQFFIAHARHRSLAWRKTEHVYPRLPAPESSRRPRLGEVLIHLRFISTVELEDALLRRPRGQRIGEYLLHAGKLTEDALQRALESQAVYPAATWMNGLAEPFPREDTSHAARVN